MSKKCSVRKLSDSSLAELANLIVSTLAFAKYSTELDLDINVVMVDINQYMEMAGTTSNIYQDLLTVILSSDYLEAAMRFISLQLLLNSGVTTLTTEVFPITYYEKILQVISAQGTGLRVLNLKGVWIKDEHMHYLFDIIKKCQYLTRLYVPYIANDDLLEVIGKYCDKLKVLDISGETDITEIGIDFLSKGACMNCLTVINVGMPGDENICHSDIAMLLEHCTNIETLSTYSFVGAALKFIYDNVNDKFTCKLKYLHDTSTDEETLKIIIKTCPQLQSLYLDTPKSGCLRVISDYASATGTNTLPLPLHKLKIYKFACKELEEALECIGHNLNHLTMIKGNGHIKLEYLAYLCPILNDLDCYMMDDLSYTSNQQKWHFQQLEGLEMLSCPMTNTSLKTFICSITQLKRLAVDNVQFNDEDIVNIFLEHDFKQLEDIWFTLAPNLTVQSVEILMDRCPELQSIGQLSGWSLTPDDLTLIRGLLRSGNSCLVLTPNGFFP